MAFDHSFLAENFFKISILKIENGNYFGKKYFPTVRGLVNSVDFLKYLIQLAKEVVRAEKEEETSEERKGAKTALTELFLEVRNDQTPAIFERIVSDIDEIVKIVRFPGWQSTAAGEREVKNALRKTLLKYNLHTDQDLFDRAYAYIREYY